MELTIKEIIVRLILALIIGGLIGYEREMKNRAAGFRTHILVCLGATVVSLIQIDIGNKVIEMIKINETLSEVIKIDYGRLGAQVITGVGFIGAGTIIHTKRNIRGLTTAATLWIVACLGLSIGMGEYFISIFATIWWAAQITAPGQFRLGGGTSGLHRAVRRPKGRDGGAISPRWTESATENKPPARVRVKWCGKSAPRI